MALAGLATYIAAREKDYEVVAQKRDADGPMLDRALEIVRKFIVERGLILFGGQAIDSALRLKGSQIYPDAQRPDFDFFSARNVDDAYDLAERLAGMGFVGVGAVRAIHVQTMKVRVDARWVADVGHVPPAVFASIPTFDFQGMRVVHPDFQRMDMHLAFCFPFNSPPREDVFHRWRKDLRRINLYEKYYPLTPTSAPAIAPSHEMDANTPDLAGGPASPNYALVRVRAAAPVVLLDSVVAEAPLTAPLDVALHGFAAYALLRDALDRLSVESATPRIPISFPDSSTVEFRLPPALASVGRRLVIATPRPARFAGEGESKWYDPYMDIYPESLCRSDLVAISTEGRLLAASHVRVTIADGPAASGETRVVSPQYLLLWFLFEAHRAEAAEQKTLFRLYYTHTLTILREAEAAFAAKISEAKGADAVMDEFAASPFAPCLSTIGSANTDNTFIIKMADNAEKAQEELPSALGVRADARSLIKGLPPRGYYPQGGKPRPAFDYDACILFRRGGLAR